MHDLRPEAYLPWQAGSSGAELRALDPSILLPAHKTGRAGSLLAGSWSVWYCHTGFTTNGCQLSSPAMPGLHRKITAAAALCLHVMHVPLDGIQSMVLSITLPPLCCLETTVCSDSYKMWASASLSPATAPHVNTKLQRVFLWASWPTWPMILAIDCCVTASI